MSKNLSVLGKSRFDSSYLTLTSIKSIKVSATIDSPAESFSAIFAPKTPFGELEHIKFHDDGQLLFSGKVDSQKTTVSKSGLLVSIDARSPGALLLDNQAKPGVMLGATIETVYNYFVTPHGFTFYNPNRGASIARFTVRSGMSEWDVLSDFSRRVYGFTPYVTGTQVMLDRRRGTSPLYISNSSGGIPYSSLSITKTPYNIISRVYYRDDNGFYREYLNNSYPEAKNISRRRFFIPTSEYSDLPIADAASRINRSMRDYEQVVVELPSAVAAVLGQDVTVSDSLIERKGHMVSGIDYIVDENGIVTRLTLINPYYYDYKRGGTAANSK